MKAILCRQGGKKLLAKKIIEKIPKHEVYVEPFVGTGAVFFKKELAKKNVLGDNDKALMDFYKQVQKLNDLKCDLRRNKTKFDSIKDKQNKSPCEFAYMTKTSFGCAGKQFNNLGEGGTNSVQKFDDQIIKLKKAQLIHDDYKNIIEKFDSTKTFHYLDPPYHKKSCSYPEGSCKVQPAEIAKTVDKIKGKFLLSYNDHPDVRSAFCQKYKCEKVKTRYTANKINDSDKQQATELLIKNY